MIPFDSIQATYTPVINGALDAALCDLFDDDRRILMDAMRYSTLGQSKRIRPLLVIASAQLFLDDYTPVLPVAAALELVHTYSLIHDDLPAMDNDDIRRGKPSCHKAYSESIAILAGDTLHSLAFEWLISQLMSQFNASAVLRMIGCLARSFGIHGIAGGQILDIATTVQRLDPALLTKIHQLKTGSLIEAALVAPAILIDQPPSTIELLRAIGRDIGLLFQIVDDILDVTGDPATLGKSVHNDNRLDKLTFVSMHGLEAAQKAVDTYAKSALDRVNQIVTGDATLLTSLISYLKTRNR